MPQDTRLEQDCVSLKRIQAPDFELVARSNRKSLQLFLITLRHKGETAPPSTYGVPTDKQALCMVVDL